MGAGSWVLGLAEALAGTSIGAGAGASAGTSAVAETGASGLEITVTLHSYTG